MRRAVIVCPPAPQKDRYHNRQRRGPHRECHEGMPAGYRRSRRDDAPSAPHPAAQSDRDRMARGQRCHNRHLLWESGQGAGRNNTGAPQQGGADSKDVWVAAATMATAPAGARMQYGRHSASADPAARTAPYRLCHANRPERACLWQVRKRTAAGPRPWRECARHPRVYVVDFIRNFMASTMHAVYASGVGGQQARCYGPVSVTDLGVLHDGPCPDAEAFVAFSVVRNARVLGGASVFASASGHLRPSGHILDSNRDMAAWWLGNMSGITGRAGPPYLSGAGSPSAFVVLPVQARAKSVFDMH